MYVDAASTVEHSIHITDLHSAVDWYLSCSCRGLGGGLIRPLMDIDDNDVAYA